MEFFLPPGLEKAMPAFTPSQQALLKQLATPEGGQAHLFADWPSTKETSPAILRQLVEQLESLDQSYPDGGLVGYIRNARRLLEASQKGVNPLEGWTPSVPTAGQTFTIGTKEYHETEAQGMEELGRVGFVLVAGGLGERLGYNGIKVELPTEITTGTCYLQFYIEYILALQHRFAKGDVTLPLCIMTSKDTHEGTLRLLKEHLYFGMVESQITLVQQGAGVPALQDNQAKFMIDPSNPYKIITKPHGHGDIHSLIHTSGVAKEWVGNGIRWISFFQDTNGLAFHTLPLALGVSKKYDLIMNSMAVPRNAKQAIGGIVRLTQTSTGLVRTINVEYNQLDPLLRATKEFADGDKNDPITGYSPFPGNINQLLFKADRYADILEHSQGLMPEFVNPKYTDATKTVFKKPTRLECMMQDFPTLLTGQDVERVGFTSIASELCFSPVKNNVEDGKALQEQGVAPGVAATGEADQYGAVRAILRSVGVQVEDAEPEIYQGITVVPGPAIVIAPDVCACPRDYKKIFPKPELVKISRRSTLIVKGPGNVVIESLELDGALVIECLKDVTATIRDVKITNAGWIRQAIGAGEKEPESIQMRGYKLIKKETSNIVLRKPADCVIL